MMKKFSKIISCLLSGILCVGCFIGCGEEAKGGTVNVQRVEDTRNISIVQNSLYSLSGTDALGREVKPVDGERTDKKKYVGMFYFTWLGQHPGGGGQTGIYDNSYLLENNPDALWDAENVKESPTGAYHFWGEPMFGYYNSEDEWVVRKHLQMLTLAGVDFLVFDATNGVAYFSVYDVVIKVLKEYAAQGWPVPKLAFYTNTNSRDTIANIYNYYYDPGCERYESCKDVWFCLDGKPMIIGDRWNFDLDNAADKAIMDSFTFKDSQWPTDINRKDGFPWMSFEYPQYVHNGVISVSIAQHTTVRMSNMENGNWGRGYDRKVGANDSSLSRAGVNYQSQWDTALSNDDVEISFITGWNEWIAIKMVDSSGKVFFVDTFNEEYSRDIEPMKGGYGDNFYLQTISNVRAFKYDVAKHYLQKKSTVSNLTQEEEWAQAVTFADFTGDAVKRDFKAYYGKNLINTTGRNDIAQIKMTHDEQNLYVKVTAADKLTEYTEGDTTYMNLFLGGEKGVYGDYNFVVNRQPDNNGKTSVEKFTKGMQTERVGECRYLVDGNSIYYVIPLDLLGFRGKDVTLKVKATDDIALTEDMSSFYTDGDSAPLGRLSYIYGY